MCFRELNSGGYENTKYRINRFVLQESGKVVEGCLTVKNQNGLSFRKETLFEGNAGPDTHLWGKV